MDNSEISEQSRSIRFKAARNAALREFIFRHDVCRSSHQCWEWTGYCCEKGYGTIIFDGFKFPVHRMSFDHYKGRIPSGLLVMHACDNPPCYNPDHLFLGTHADNMQDMVRKGRHASQRNDGEPRPENKHQMLSDMINQEKKVSWAWGNPR